MFATACIANNKKKRRMNEKLNHLGMDVGKRKCKVVFKDDKGMILDEFLFAIDVIGIGDLYQPWNAN